MKRDQEETNIFDEEEWYECPQCSALMYGFQSSCWACGIHLAENQLYIVNLER